MAKKKEAKVEETKVEATTEQAQEEQGAFDLDGGVRMALYEEYSKQSQGEPEPEPEEAVQPEPEPAVEPTEKEPESEPEVPETPSEKVEAKDERTVPYGALHEERMKRKEAQNEVKELKQQVQTLLADQKKIMESQVERPQEYGYDIPEVAQLKGHIERLEDHIRNLEQGFNVYQTNAERDKTQKTIAKIDGELANQGIKGFAQFEPMIAHVVQERIDESPDDTWWNTPEGWKKAYVEVVFPQVKEIFKSEDKKETMDAKTILKKQANLASSGKPSEKPREAKKDWTFEDYMEMRKHNPIFSG